VTVLAAVAVLAGPALLAGCARADDASPSSATPSRTLLSRAPSAGATGTSPSPTAMPSRSPNPAPSPTGTPVFDERTAVPCAGHPSGEQIIALLRRTGGFIPSGANATVTTGPMCAGTWQYTVVAVPDRDPLHVVTKGAPTALELVTAGTDVCTVDVRALAPAGIRAITRC
jgi:hypothetical protein